MNGIYYEQLRTMHNINKAFYGGYDTEGVFGFPRLEPTTPGDLDVIKSIKTWIPFNYALSTREGRQDIGVHFFLHDYQFERVWQKPDKYVKLLAQFGAVCSPDFSFYVDFPLAISIYNIYRKKWLARYWQDHGIIVVPTIRFGYKDSYAWCFDGDPAGGAVAFSSQSYTRAHMEEDLVAGYEETVRRLEPSHFLWLGRVPEGIVLDDSKVTKLEPYTKRLKALDASKRR